MSKPQEPLSPETHVQFTLRQMVVACCTFGTAILSLTGLWYANEHRHDYEAGKRNEIIQQLRDEMKASHQQLRDDYRKADESMRDESRAADQQSLLERQRLGTDVRDLEKRVDRLERK